MPSMEMLLLGLSSLAILLSLQVAMLQSLPMILLLMMPLLMMVLLEDDAVLEDAVAGECRRWGNTVAGDAVAKVCRHLRIPSL